LGKAKFHRSEALNAGTSAALGSFSRKGGRGGKKEGKTARPAYSTLDLKKLEKKE